jgi:membrane-bound inhibitor of C-type lysozyme
MNCSAPPLGRALLTTLLFLVGAINGAVAQDPKPVHYTCADGTKLQAMFSPPSTSLGSVKLVYAGSSTETTLPQAISADGGRYRQGNVEFWIKGNGATLTRAGKSTTCRTGS